MALPVYLAMTAAEFHSGRTLPEHPAWMACHFSCYGTGLSNRPEKLPKRSMVILNDRTPVHGHDPGLIAEQLLQIVSENDVGGVLLDFQRENCDQTQAIAKAIVETLPCPVGVTEFYAKELDCPVFLPPPPLHRPLTEHLSPWSGRELWLEAALDAVAITVTAEGSRFESALAPEPSAPSHLERQLFCRYCTDVLESQAIFTLFRTRQTLDDMLQEAERLGVTRSVGLYQELGSNQ